MLSRYLAVFVIVLSPAIAFGQALADRVPDKVILYAGWQGSESLGPDYEQSHLKGFLDDSNLPELFNDFLPRLIEKFGSGDPQVAEGMQLLSTVGGPMFRHPSAFFLASVEMNAGRAPMPHLALICDAGAEAAKLEADLEKQLQHIPPGGPAVFVTHDGELVILSVGYRAGELRLPKTKEDSLANDAAFGRLVGIAGKNRAATVYINAVAALETIDSAVKLFGDAENQEKWAKLNDALGLSGLKQAIWTSGFEGKDWGTNLFIAAPAPRTGLLAMLEGKPLSDELLTVIPKGATMAGAGHLDLLRLVDQIRTASAMIDPGIPRQIDGALQSVSQMVGVDIEKDFLGSFGNEWAYYVDPAIGGRGLLGFTVLNRLQDAAKADDVFKKVEKGIEDFSTQQMPNKNLHITFRSVKSGEQEINYLAIPFVTPSWAIKDGNLFGALYPQVVASAASHSAVKSRSILENKAFAALRTQLGGESASSFQFVDLPKTAIDSYGSWLAVSHLTQLGDLFGVPAPPMLLPRLSILLKNLSPSGEFSFADADGFHLHAVGPFPGAELLGSDPMALAAPQQAIAVSILLPSLNRAREQANRVKSAANLRQIGLAATIYASAAKNQEFPSSLSEIVKTQDITPQTFFSPRTGTPPPAPGLTADQAAEWVEEHSDYIWTGKGLNERAPADKILAYENPAKVKRGINILYADGHVEFKPMYAARLEIDKAKNLVN